MRFRPAIASALLLSACALKPASVPPYHPLREGVGYSEVAIGEHRYEVMYHGNQDQDDVMAKNLALLHAAEIGKREGFGYFQLEDSKSTQKKGKEVVRETETRHGPGSPYGNRNWRPRSESRTVTRLGKRPIAKIFVLYQNEPCEECISIETELLQGAKKGWLPR